VRAEAPIMETHTRFRKGKASGVTSAITVQYGMELVCANAKGITLPNASRSVLEKLNRFVRAAFIVSDNPQNPYQFRLNGYFVVTTTTHREHFAKAQRAGSAMILC
jgi:hypothetical protein